MLSLGAHIAAFTLSVELFWVVSSNKIHRAKFRFVFEFIDFIHIVFL